ncbi:Hypothetical predicted protein [Lecanosticta acicola]|uniref:Thioesterase domain-containing protein n=1 Tax=Lecanosticta acicola TaxID=111012 RepID=A0AAI8YVH3_9PEZI|nr:Hypothetical predicted protein [Lecanosticta acicola]
MACVGSIYQAGYQQYHDAMALRRNSIQRMSDPNTAILRTAQEVKLIDFRAYESHSRTTTTQHQQNRRSSVRKCSSATQGRRSSIQSTYTALQAPTHAQWVQRLPANPSAYEEFLESALEEIVAQLVCGPNAAAEEAELGYNYDTLEDVAPEAWVRVRAHVVESQGKSWIEASITSKVETNERAAVFAYGKWELVKTKKPC